MGPSADAYLPVRLTERERAALAEMEREMTFRDRDFVTRLGLLWSLHAGASTECTATLQVMTPSAPRRTSTREGLHLALAVSLAIAALGILVIVSCMVVSSLARTPLIGAVSGMG